MKFKELQEKFESYLKSPYTSSGNPANFTIVSDPSYKEMLEIMQNEGSGMSIRPNHEKIAIIIDEKKDVVYAFSRRLLHDNVADLYHLSDNDHIRLNLMFDLSKKKFAVLEASPNHGSNSMKRKREIFTKVINSPFIQMYIDPERKQNILEEFGQELGIKKERD